MNIRNRIASVLLALLNGRFLNGTPGRYAWVNNEDVFEREFLEHHAADTPVREILSVEWVDADIWTAHALNQELNKPV